MTKIGAGYASPTGLFRLKTGLFQQTGNKTETYLAKAL
jgi:hypothetical protein